MRGLNFLSLLALAHTAAFVCALPLTTGPSRLIRTDPSPSNALCPASDSHISHRDSLASRTPATYSSYAIGTETKVLIQTGWMAMNVWKITDLLRATTRLATQRITEHGDGVIPVNDLIELGNSMIGEGVYLTLKNANNHQLTYGVVHAAVGALSAFVHRCGGFQNLDFQIIDGKTLVGTGKIVA